MTHPVDPEAVNTLAEWLRNGLSAKEVRFNDMDERETFLFRAFGHADNPFELEISYEAFERAPVDVITADLENRSALDLLKQDPTVRLFYSSQDGLNHNERRAIECDGRQYVVTRNRDHVVDIWDADGQRLARMPNEPAVSPASIHRTYDDHWCDRVRTWRSPNQ